MYNNLYNSYISIYTLYVHSQKNKNNNNYQDTHIKIYTYTNQ